jgi:hypothetical protein
MRPRHLLLAVLAAVLAACTSTPTLPATPSAPASFDETAPAPRDSVTGGLGSGNGG